MKKKYYWVVIDKVCKTLELVESEGCEATTQDKVLKMYGLNCNWYNQGRLRLCFNGTDSKVNYDTLYKYARKFEII